MILAYPFLRKVENSVMVIWLTREQLPKMEQPTPLYQSQFVACTHRCCTWTPLSFSIHNDILPSRKRFIVFKKVLGLDLTLGFVPSALSPCDPCKGESLPPPYWQQCQLSIPFIKKPAESVSAGIGISAGGVAWDNRIGVILWREKNINIIFSVSMSYIAIVCLLQFVSS